MLLYISYPLLCENEYRYIFKCLLNALTVHLGVLLLDSITETDSDCCDVLL